MTRKGNGGSPDANAFPPEERKQKRPRLGKRISAARIFLGFGAAAAVVLIRKWLPKPPVASALIGFSDLAGFTDFTLEQSDMLYVFRSQVDDLRLSGLLDPA